MTKHEINKELIKSFKSKNEGDDLERFLKDPERAWKEDKDGELSVYLIKDKDGKIAAYFSIRCGLIIDSEVEDNFSKEENELIALYTKASKEKDEEEKEKLYNCMVNFYGEKADTLVSNALDRLDKKTEKERTNQEKSTMYVSNSYSAVELKHFCKNANYKIIDELKCPLGVGLFWKKIVPLFVKISKTVGCRYLYLFAADITRDNSYDDIKQGIFDDELEEDALSKKKDRLINYYKSHFGFGECNEAVRLIKPSYDDYCYGLMQKVDGLLQSEKRFWMQFSDIYGETVK